MNRMTFLLIWTVLAAALFTFMVIAWRARKRRDSGLALPAIGLAGDIIATFAHAGYVSTTPEGAPLERLAIPGLRYKGWANITVRADGIELAVTGERPVEIAADRVLGTDYAGGRIGKVVERDGLALLGWQSADGRRVESSFRFNSPTEQRRFADAIAEITPDIIQTTHTSQEDA